MSITLIVRPRSSPTLHSGGAADIAAGAATPSTRGTVLIVDDDPLLAVLVHDLLTDEGDTVFALTTITSDAVRTAVDRLEPDCLLLDSRGPLDYGDSWRDAAWSRARPRRIPVIMFTASTAAVQEAEAGQSPRSQASGFFAVIAKPFDLDALLTTVEHAVGSVSRFDRTGTADTRPAEFLATALHDLPPQRSTR